MPAHPMALALIEALGAGIAAPSANRFGAVSPTTADHVAADLGEDVDYILDGGPCAVGVESTIVDLSRAHPVLLRPGGLPREAIEPIVGPLLAADEQAPAAPGTLASHYAPHAEVRAVEPRDVPAEVACAIAELRAGMQLRAVLAGAADVDAHRLAAAADVARRVAVLAPAAAFAAWPTLAVLAKKLPDDPAGMARELYAALRDLDAAGVDVVIAALPPAVGLGEAVADRLRRSAGPRERDET
jgi:L-threonylcarbamoyladenylate synthase